MSRVTVVAFLWAVILAVTAQNPTEVPPIPYPTTTTTPITTPKTTPLPTSKPTTAPTPAPPQRTPPAGGVPGYDGVPVECHTLNSACFSVQKPMKPDGQMIIVPNNYCKPYEESCVANLYVTRFENGTIHWILFKTNSIQFMESCVAISIDPFAPHTIPWICNKDSSDRGRANGYVGIYTEQRKMKKWKPKKGDFKTYKNEEGNQEYQRSVFNRKGVVFSSTDLHKDLNSTNGFNAYLDEVFIYGYTDIRWPWPTITGMSEEEGRLFLPPRPIPTPIPGPAPTTTTPKVTTPTAPNNESSDVNWGMIVIIIFSIVLAILTAVLIAVFIRYKRKKAVMNAKGFTPDDPEYHNFSIKEFPSTVGSTISETPDKMTTGSTIGKTTIRTIDDSGIASNKTIK